ncbi:hypothetical protein [Massilia sp. S19_KUP03_FR1]|uniref:hypothetical protein n=1 Tax=Massilia sp. S19_KUP03_FR1 TaxID=3025503 RepID=UPI002FCDD184
MLNALDVLCEYVLKVNTWIDSDARSQNAEKLVVTIIKAPIFNIEEIMKKISETGYTAQSRFSTRFNAHFSGLYFLDASTEIEQVTLDKYYELQRNFLNEQK